MSTEVIIELANVHKSYGNGETAVKALRDINLTVCTGDYVAIMGPSGSGKSTLLNILGCLDVPSNGTYLLSGVAVAQQRAGALARIRNKKIGFIFQDFNLIPRLTALANVELPLSYAGVCKTERRQRALAALELVGLVDRITHKPTELSGGQQQRVAIARALVCQPDVVLADEPTGNLDSANASEVMDILSRLNEAGRTIVVITHEQDVAKRAKRILYLTDGCLTSVRKPRDASGRVKVWS